MLRQSVAASLFVVLALSLPMQAGCGKTKQKLTEVAVPEAGVSLRYDLTPGQEYAGHVELRNSFQTPVGDVVTLLEFDAALVVSASETAGSKLVRATVTNIVLDMRLPEGIPAAMAGGMTPEAATALNGMELRFNLSEHGEVSNEPEPPESAPMETKAIVGMIISALTAGFVRVPEQPVKDGESWDARSDDPDLKVKSASHTGTLEGLGRTAAGEDIATLAFTASLEAEREGQLIKGTQDVKAAFSTTGGYVASVERKLNNTVGEGSVATQIEARWTKGGKQAVEAAAPASAEQTITDPCDPDYVGAEDCPTTAPPADAAPAS